MESTQKQRMVQAYQFQLQAANRKLRKFLPVKASDFEGAQHIVQPSGRRVSGSASDTGGSFGLGSDDEEQQNVGYWKELETKLYKELQEQIDLSAEVYEELNVEREKTEMQELWIEREKNKAQKSSAT